MTSLITSTDEALMLAFAQGSQTAFTELYQRYHRMVYGYLIGRTAGNQTTANEVSQEVWLNLIRYSSHYTVSASFKTFLFRIVNTKLIDHYRIQHASPISKSVDIDDYYDIQEESDLSSDLGSDFDNPEQIAIRECEVNQLKRALQQLPEHHREILLNSFVKGMTVPEIAAEQGIPLERAKSRLRYAKQALTEAIAQLQQAKIIS